MTGGRPRRPALEARLVREAVADVDPSAPREPLARSLAARVVRELGAFIDEPTDPTINALGELLRAACPTPVRALATDPDVDTLALFIRRRIERLEARFGRSLSPADDLKERRSILKGLESVLTRRYLRHLRAI